MKLLCLLWVFMITASAHAQDAVTLVQQALLTALIVAAPILLVGMAVGLLIGLAQALTQVQDQTVSFVPKIIAIFITMLITLPFLGATMAGYMDRVVDMIIVGG